MLSTAFDKLLHREVGVDDIVVALLARVADEYSQENDVTALLDAVQQVLSDMRTQELPHARDEFETRAVLYYILLRTEDFLLLKRQFHDAYTPSLSP